MKKILKVWGGSLAITFDAEERKIYEMKEGCIIDFEIKSIEPPNNKK